MTPLKLFLSMEIITKIGTFSAKIIYKKAEDTLLIEKSFLLMKHKKSPILEIL
jgi:hypothetical protein